MYYINKQINNKIYYNPAKKLGAHSQPWVPVIPVTVINDCDFLLCTM